MPKPWDFSVPMPENQSAPWSRIGGHRGDRLDVVDHGRAGVEARDGGERRLEARLAATALEAVEQRGLLATDVGAGAGVHGDVEVEAGAWMFLPRWPAAYASSTARSRRR